MLLDFKELTKNEFWEQKEWLVSWSSFLALRHGRFFENIKPSATRAGPARGLQGVWVPALMFISPRSPANLYRTLMTRSKSSRRRRKACPAALMRASLQTTSALTQNKSRKPAQTSDSYKKVVILVTAHSFTIFSVPNIMWNESPIPEMLRIAQVTNWNEKNVITSS